MAIIEIHRILDEVRLLGCSDLHFTDRIAPVVRLMVHSEQCVHSILKWTKKKSSILYIR